MKELLLYTMLNVSLVSPNKDTLILQNNELGKAIANLWKEYPKDSIKTPIIIFTKNLQNPFTLTKNK